MITVKPANDAAFKPVRFCLMQLFVLLSSALMMSCQSRYGSNPSGENISSLYTQRMLNQMPVDQRGVHRFSCENTIIEMETFYKQRNYSQAEQKALQIIENFCASQPSYKAYWMLGELSYLAQKPVDALYNYSEAVQFANKSERSELMEKCVHAALETGPQELITKSRMINPESWRSDLLLNVGMSYMKDGKNQDAIVVLKAFNEEFPGNRNEAQVDGYIEELSLKLSFNKNRIGVLLPLSGAYQRIGYRILQAIEIAVDRNNKTEANRDVRIIVKDTGGDPEKAVSAVKALAQEQVAGIIGPLVTATEAAAEANRLGIPMIVLTQKEEVTRTGRYIFRNFITPEMQAEALVSYLTQALNIRRFAVMYPNEKYGIALKDAFINTLRDFDGELTDIESYAPDQTDFAQQINRLILGYLSIGENGDVQELTIDEPRKRHGNYEAIVNFEALFIPDSVEVATMIAPQLRYHDIDNIILVGTNLWSAENLIKLAGPYVQSAIFPSTYLPDKAEQENSYFISAYSSLDDSPPGFIEAISFDTACIMLSVLSMPETRSRDDVVRGLLAVRNFDSLSGMSSFEASGEPVIRLELCQIINNRPVIINN